MCVMVWYGIVVVVVGVVIMQGFQISYLAGYHWSGSDPRGERQCLSILRRRSGELYTVHLDQFVC